MSIDPQEIGLEHIQTISPLFAHSGFNNPLAAAAYYTLLLKNFPTTFNLINKEAKTLLQKEHKRNRIISGRQELMLQGYIAHVLPIEDNNPNFDRETYLPIAPEFVWDDNIDNLAKVITKNEKEHKLTKIKELSEVFKKNFGTYGIKKETGTITLFHSSKWLLYTLVYNTKLNKVLRMQLGSLGSFVSPTINYYEKMLNDNIKTKIICDLTEQDINERISNIWNLKIKYTKNIEIRSAPTTYGTSRRMIYDNMLIDGKKLLSFGDGDLSYISTIYLQKDLISRMQKNFETLWKICKDFDSFNLPMMNKPVLNDLP
jgi:hypothetical protein